MSFNDPFDAATNAGERSNTYFGKIEVNVSFVKLIKGAGQVPFMDGTDNPNDRCTAIHIILNPIEASGLTQLVERKLIAESGTWSRIMWPSLRDNCGLKNLRDLNGQWAKVEMVKTGRVYEDKRGEKHEETTFKFLAVYSNAGEATTAFLRERGTAPDDTLNIDMGHGAGAPLSGTIKGVDGSVSASNPERDTALQFLGALVKQANGDKTKLASMIATMPMIGKYFTADSPEVVQLMAVR